MTKKICLIKLIFFNFLLLYTVQAHSATKYDLTIDTSSLQGSQALIAYDLIDGAPGFTSIFLDKPQIDGVFFGVNSTLEDLNFYNTLEQEITLGNELIVRFSLSSGGVPSNGYLPDSFSIFLLDLFGIPLINTSDPTGADSLVQWDIGMSDPSVFNGNLNTSSTITNSVPEPPTILLFIIAWLSFLIQKKPRLTLLVISSIFMANSPTAVSAPSLSSSTDLALQSELKASGLRLNRQTNTYDSLLTITNKSQASLDKPFTVAVLSLPTGVILSNATEISDEGTPLITVDSGQPLPAGSSMTITLKFVNRTNQAFPLTFRLVRLTQPIPDLVKLLGPDVDGNGVRDDLEPILDSRYSNTRERSAAIQILKAMRNGLGSTSSVESAFGATLLVNKSFDCIFSLIDPTQAESEISFLRDEMMNTRERVTGWILLSEMIAGQSAPIGTNNSCEFQQIGQ